MNHLFGSQSNDTKEYSSRYKYIYFIVALILTLLAARIWHLQIVSGEKLRTYSEKNSLKRSTIEAPRGLILDRDKTTLVGNLPGFMLTISPQYISLPTDPKKIKVAKLKNLAHAISPIVGISPNDIVNKVNKSRYRNGPFLSVKIKKNLSRDEIFFLKRMRIDFPGLNIEETIVRKYYLGENGAQLFGYIRQISKNEIEKFQKKYKDSKFEAGDMVGKSGLELSWERTLKGVNGANFVEVDAKGRKSFSVSSQFLNTKPTPPKTGQSVVLTIDKDIQEAAYKSFFRDDYVGDRVGSIVVLKNTGEILAWVSTPSYDPNQFSTGISNQTWSQMINDPKRPLVNKVIQDHYPPGSTFKPLIALAALQEKVITPYRLVHSPGTYTLGRRTYHDAHIEGHGKINLMSAIERSANVYFYKAGQALGIDRIHNYLTEFGLGQKTNLQIGYEVSGLIPSKKWKKETKGEVWTPGETLVASIGQGYVVVTSIQMAKAYNAIAQEGKLYKPYLVKKILDGNDKVVKEFEPTLIRDLTVKDPNNPIKIEKSHFKHVKKGMRDVFQGRNGTAKWYKVKGIEMAGKTGTSQVKSFSSNNIFKRCKEMVYKNRHHGWFVGFAPYEEPEITIAIFAEHSCSGARGGAGSFKDIVLAYLKKYKPDLYKKTQKKIALNKVQQ